MDSRWVVGLRVGTRWGCAAKFHARISAETAVVMRKLLFCEQALPKINQAPPKINQALPSQPLPLLLPIPKTAVPPKPPNVEVGKPGCGNTEHVIAHRRRRCCAEGAMPFPAAVGNPAPSHQTIEEELLAAPKRHALTDGGDIGPPRKRGSHLSSVPATPN